VRFDLPVSVPGEMSRDELLVVVARQAEQLAGLRGPYDLIIASHIFHHFSETALPDTDAPAVRGAQARRAAGDPGFRVGSPPAEAPFLYLFSVRMLTWTREGEAHSLDTYRRLLRDAGFSPPEVHAGQGMPSSFLIAGRAGTEG
jgi:hypothetical protein